MSTVYNLYCDESCHLENDGQKAMVLGAVWCPDDKLAAPPERDGAVTPSTHGR